MSKDADTDTEYPYFWNEYLVDLYEAVLFYSEGPTEGICPVDSRPMVHLKRAIQKNIPAQAVASTTGEQSAWR